MNLNFTHMSYTMKKKKEFLEVTGNYLYFPHPPDSALKYFHTDIRMNYMNSIAHMEFK